MLTKKSSTAHGLFWQLTRALCVICVSTSWSGCGKPAAPAVPSKNPPPVKAGTNTAAAATMATATNNNPVAITRAVFEERPSSGRDPFFPDSERRRQVSATSAEAEGQQPQLPLSSYVKLTGISPGKPKPLALLNKTQFEPGERGEVSVTFTNSQNRAETRKVMIRCLEIRRDSVIISIEGEPGSKELQMLSGP